MWGSGPVGEAGVSGVGAGCTHSRGTGFALPPSSVAMMLTPVTPSRRSR